MEAGDVGRDPDGGWPARLSWQELRDVLARHDIAVAPASPIRAVAEQLRPQDTSPRANDPGASAVRVVAQARQYVTVRSNGHEQESLYVNDGRACVRWASDQDGVTLGMPLPHAEFAAGISLGVANAGEAPAGERRAVSRALLSRIAAARGSGLFLDGASVSRAELESVATGAAPAERAGRIVEDLVSAAVAVEEGDRVRASAAWVRENPFLVEEPRLTLRAVELTGTETPRQPPRAVSVLGSSDARLVYDPGTSLPEEGDILLGLARLSRKSLARAVVTLLGAPVSPPNAPGGDYDGDPWDWFTGEPSTDLPPWRNCTFADIAVPATGEAAAPAAMFAPAATIQVLAWSRDRAETASKTLALAPDCAVEWAMEGSRVRWRALDAPGTARWLQELTAIVHANGTAAATSEELRLGRHELTGLIGARDQAPAAPGADPRLLALAGGETIWVLVRVLVGPGGPPRARELLIGSSVAGAWWFTPAEHGYAARSGDPEAFVHEIEAALRAARA